MMKFDIFLHPLGDNISGFDLGGISIQINDTEFTSANKKPAQSMMIFIALSDLLDGIRCLWEGKEKEFKFVGADSSFTILFRKDEKNILYLEAGKQIAETDFKEFRDQCYFGIERFYLSYCDKIAPDDDAIFDLKNSLSQYKAGMIGSNGR
jgi:hypothetical protein